MLIQQNVGMIQMVRRNVWRIIPLEGVPVDDNGYPIASLSSLSTTTDSTTKTNTNKNKKSTKEEKEEQLWWEQFTPC